MQNVLQIMKSGNQVQTSRIGNFEPGRPMDRARPNTGRTQAKHNAQHKPRLQNRVCRTVFPEHRPSACLQTKHKRLPNTSCVCRTALAEHRPNTTPNNIAVSKHNAEHWPNRIHRPLGLVHGVPFVFAPIEAVHAACLWHPFQWDPDEERHVQNHQDNTTHYIRRC